MNLSALSAPNISHRRGSLRSAARMLRRRNTLRGRAQLGELSALAVLELLPVPVLAVDSRGAVVFSNNAFADLLGYPKSSVLEMNLRQLLLGLTLEEFVLPFLHARAGRAVNLIHAQGWVLQTQMSVSAARRHEDQVMLSTFVPLPTTSATRGNRATPTPT